MSHILCYTYIINNNFKYHVSCIGGKISVRIKLEIPFSLSSKSIVLLFAVGLLLLSRYFNRLFWSCPSQETEETSTPNNTCLKCRDNDESPTGKNTTIEWDDGEKGNSNSCTDGKISVRIKLEIPFSLSSKSIVLLFPVGLLLLSRHF